LALFPSIRDLYLRLGIFVVHLNSKRQNIAHTHTILDEIYIGLYPLIVVSMDQKKMYDASKQHFGKSHQHIFFFYLKTLDRHIFQPRPSS